jgi:tetratricopeptide (TPR) repeat protein
MSELTPDPEQAKKYKETADLRAQNAITKLNPIAFKAPNLLPAWITLVRCCVYLRDFDLASRYIQNGYQLASEPSVRQEIARLAAQILIEQSDEYKDMNDESQFRKRLFALCESIATDFRLEVAFQRVLDFFDKDKATSQQDLWLRDAIVGSANQRIPGVIHILLGMREISDGNFAEGKKHWEIASQQFQFAQYAINNLIRVYTREKKLPFDEKIDFLTVALELFPQQPAFYMTRGEFNKEAGNYEQAAEDLEIAAIDLPKMLSIFEDLAECYEKLGNDEKTLKYKNKVERLRAELEAQQRGEELPVAPPSDEDKNKNDEK